MKHNNYLKDVPLERVKEYEEALYAALDTTYSDLTDTIAASGQLTKETNDRLDEALRAFTQQFLGQ